MLKNIYANWMYRWERKLTRRDGTRVIRPLEWGFEWISSFFNSHGFGSYVPTPNEAQDNTAAEAAMLRINDLLLTHHDLFFSYTRPTDFRLEERYPELCPTNTRPETVAKDAKLKKQAAEGKLTKVQFLRFTSPERTPFPENNLVNARWYPAPNRKKGNLPRQAIVILPQWNADAFSHNALCSLFNRFHISALRLSMPYHDIRRPSGLERADYAMSANIGRTISACRQAVVDIRCCLDWLEEQGYEQLGVLGTSLGSCYAWMASTHDRRLRVNVFNHVSTMFGDVAWSGLSTRHIRAGVESFGLTQERLRKLWSAISPCSYYRKLVSEESAGSQKRALVIYAPYDLTFPLEYTLEVLQGFKSVGLNHEVRVLPCGHYTTGETPFQYIDGWHMSSFVYRAFKALRKEAATTLDPELVPAVEEDEEVFTR